MRAIVLGLAAPLAALALPAAPAAAQEWTGSALGVSAVQEHRDRDRSDRQWARDRRGFDCDFRHHRRDRRHHRPDRRRVDCDVFVGPWVGGEWALYNNRSWESDSYNDWWHDRPDRAYPRWTRSNQDCQRLWWSGGGWRC